MEKAITTALDFGFSQSGRLASDTMVFLPQVREMCRDDKCKMFNQCWTCPPACGTLEECEAKARLYEDGIIVQTTTALDDPFDYEAMVEAERKHKALFVTLMLELKKSYPELLALGAGGCNVCEECTYPDAPCVFPDKAFVSMEAFGLWVSDVCEKNNIRYYYGENTMTYTSCYLLNKR